MSFLDAFRRRRQYQTPGFAGGYLDDQLNPRPYSDGEPGTGFDYSRRYPTMDTRPEDVQRDLNTARRLGINIPRMSGIDTPQQLQQPTPPDQQTRPRTVSPFVDRLMQGQTRPRIADPTSFDAEHLRELESQPLGLRGKAGLVAQNIATNLGFKPLATRRQRDIEEVGGRLSRDVALDRNRIALEQGQMVPFTLPDGTVTYVPAKSAGSLASRQQNQQGTLSERKRLNDAHVKRWGTMGQHEAAQDAQRLYNSGAADDNDDLKDEIVRRMGLPVGTKLPDSSQGQVGVDANGNYVVIDKRKGTAAPVMQEDKPVESMQKTTEAGRNRRFNEGQAGADRRASMAQAGANQRAEMRQAGGGGMTLPQKVAAEKLVARYNFVRKQEMDLKTPKEQKALLQKQREALGNQIYATYPGMFEEGEGGEIRAKAGASEASQSQATGGSFNLGAWKADHPNATQEQIQAQRSKAKARNLAIVE